MNDDGVLQLLDHLRDTLERGSLDGVQAGYVLNHLTEVIIGLERNDSSFHRYRIIRDMKSRVEHVLKNVLDEVLPHVVMSSQTDTSRCCCFSGN